MNGGDFFQDTMKRFSKLREITNNSNAQISCGINRTLKNSIVALGTSTTSTISRNISLANNVFR